MGPRQALSKWALLWHGTNMLVGVRLASARPAGKKKQGGETRSPPYGWVQNSQGGCGRGARSGLGLLWQVCSQLCAQEGEEEGVQVRGDRGASTVCMAGLVLSPPKVSQPVQQWSGQLWRLLCFEFGFGGISPVLEAGVLGWRAAAALGWRAAAALVWRAAAALGWKAFFAAESVLQDEVVSYLEYVFDSGAGRVTAFWASEVVVPVV